jgi:hypothetical protein
MLSAGKDSVKEFFLACWHYILVILNFKFQETVERKYVFFSSQVLMPLDKLLLIKKNS